MSQSLFDQALKAEGITGQLADLARSIYKQESGGGKNTKTSNAGAVGGMQIIPSTFKSVADKDWNISDPLQNARAGIRYLKQLHKSTGGDASLTAVGYYGGPGGIAKAKKGIPVNDPRNPDAPNTLQYAASVVGRMPGGGVQVASNTPVGRRPDGSVQVLAPTPAPVDDRGPVAPPFASLPPPEAEPTVYAAQAQGPNAWDAFIQTVNQARGPVSAQDLDYAQAMPPPAQYQQAQVLPPSGRVSYGRPSQGPQAPGGSRLAAMKNFVDMADWGHFVA